MRRKRALLLLALSAAVACAGARDRSGAAGEAVDQGAAHRTRRDPAEGLRYVATTGYVGHRMRAEIESDEALCPRPWTATVAGVEGALPRGVTLRKPSGEIEGVPEAPGTWTVRVLLDDFVCGDAAPDPAYLPVTMTIEEYRPEPPPAAIGPRPAPAPAGPPTDEDGDGVTDDLDRCPRTAPRVVVDAEGCARDSDGDQVPDGLDECPDTPRGTFVDVDGCVIPDR